MADYKQRSQKYAQKLKDPRWQKKRLKILEIGMSGHVKTVGVQRIHSLFTINIISIKRAMGLP